MKHCFLIYFLSIILISGCNESQNDLSHMEKENEVENLEYAVYNQTLSLLGEYILFNQNSYSINDKFEIEDFNNRFDINDKTRLFERIKLEGIDTSKVGLSKIDFLIMPDSLDEKNGLKRKEFSIDKINYPKGVILIKSNDKIRELNFFIKSIQLSRIVFNESKNKAEYEFGIVRGPMNGTGISVKCEFRNGAWIIVETKTTWIS